MGGRSPLPWLHIAEVVAKEARAKGYGKPGLTGTQWLVESDVYPTALEAVDLGWVRPEPADRAEMSRIIMDELVWRCVSQDLDGPAAGDHRAAGPGRL